MVFWKQAPLAVTVFADLPGQEAFSPLIKKFCCIVCQNRQPTTSKAKANMEQRCTFQNIALQLVWGEWSSPRRAPTVFSILIVREHGHQQRGWPHCSLQFCDTTISTHNINDKSVSYNQIKSQVEV